MGLFGSLLRKSSDISDSNESLTELQIETSVVGHDDTDGRKRCPQSSPSRSVGFLERVDEDSKPAPDASITSLVETIAVAESAQPTACVDSTCISAERVAIEVPRPPDTSAGTPYPTSSICAPSQLDGVWCSSLKLSQCREVILPGMRGGVPQTAKPAEVLQPIAFDDSITNVSIDDRKHNTEANTDRVTVSDGQGHKPLRKAHTLHVQEVLEEGLGFGDVVVSSRPKSLHLSRQPSIVQHIRSDLRQEMATLPGSLRVMTKFIMALFVLSLLSLVVFSALLLLHPDVEGDGQAERKPFPAWMAWQVSWPSFFMPNAIALGADASSFYVAGGRVLLELTCDFSSSVAHPVCNVRRRLLLPEPVVGLGQIAGELVAIASTTRGWAISKSAEVISDDKGDWPLGGLLLAAAQWRPQPQTDGLPLLPQFRLPVDAMPARAAHVLEVMVSGRMIAAAAVVGDDNELRLCGETAANGSSQAGDWQELVKLRPSGRLFSQVTAVYVCSAGLCAGEPVLWIATEGGMKSLAVSLETGRLLADFDSPRQTDSADPQPWQLDSPSCLIRGNVTALTGNETHLIAIVALDNCWPVVWSAPHPLLVDGAAHSEF